MDVRAGAVCGLGADSMDRCQPWSTYAVHLTTLSHWALACDCLLIYLYFRGTTQWDQNTQTLGLSVLIAWMFLSKFVKLMGHYIRFPGDFLLLPVSILFGYFHSLAIKVYAMLSLNVVSQPHTKLFRTRLFPQIAPLAKIIRDDLPFFSRAGFGWSDGPCRQHGEVAMEQMTTTHSA